MASALTIVALALMSAGAAHGAGARLYKSGPIQITTDGSKVWVANPDNDSVSRIDTATLAVLEVLLPGGSRHRPTGLSLRDDGSEVWVACQESDRVYVLAGSDGAVLARIDLPWGTGPRSIALAPPDLGGDQTVALVAGYRGARLALLDVASRSLLRLLEPVFHAPHGIAFTDDGAAWVTHLFADGEHPRLSRVELTDPASARVTTKQRVGATHPQDSQKTGVFPAEGGYQTLRGHPAQVPNGADGGRLWIPVQTQNLHDHAPSPDSVVQSVIRKVDVARRTVAGGTNQPSNPAHPARVITSAVGVHDPTRSSNSPVFDGPGWDAGVSGPVDLAFSASGDTAWLLHEQSEDVLVLPTDIPPVRPGGATDLVEIPVGKRPMGIVASPVSDLAYVANVLSRDVSVLDLATQTETARVPVTPISGEPFSAALLRGAQIFYSSNESAISANRKVSCASCHLDGEHDGRTWDNEHLPGAHGPRSTQTLGTVAASFGPTDPATGWGQLHRSGDRDEVQDFEHTFRGPQMGGTGFVAGTPNPELGAANAGLSGDLDDLAAYVLSLEPPLRSPYRQADGSLTLAARRGATFFKGSDPTRPADAGCAGCHDPASGFSDRGFHDVGQAVRPGEQELQNRVPANHVNTPSLLGLWATSPYDGIVGFSGGTLLGALLDFRDRVGARAPHGDLDSLTDRQLRDLETFLLSLDGATTAAEVAAADDVAPPHVVRVAATSRTRVEVWLDESVDTASAESVAAWQITDAASGQAFAVVAAALDSQNGDRVTLTTAPLAAGCSQPRQYLLTPVGPIFDLADRATGGTANGLVGGSAVPFAVESPLTITLGASGYENVTVAVHDAATIPGLSTWSHGSAWLLPNPLNTGFVRFEWSGAFTAATGSADPADLVAAEILLDPDLGDAQLVEARRVLQVWYDHRRPDFSSNPVDPTTGNRGPTWNHSQHGLVSWNSANAGARAAGVEGDVTSDYHGGWDTAYTPDAAVPMPAINEALVLGGPRVDEALRFWMANPSFDHGYALRLVSGAALDARFRASEEALGDRGPVLRLRYRLSACSEELLFADDFESATTAAWSLVVP